MLLKAPCAAKGVRPLHRGAGEDRRRAVERPDEVRHLVLHAVRERAAVADDQRRPPGVRARGCSRASGRPPTRRWSFPSAGRTRWPRRRGRRRASSCRSWSHGNPNPNGSVLPCATAPSSSFFMSARQGRLRRLQAGRVARLADRPHEVVVRQAAHVVEVQRVACVERTGHVRVRPMSGVLEVERGIGVREARGEPSRRDREVQLRGAELQVALPLVLRVEARTGSRSGDRRSGSCPRGRRRAQPQ
jgi:hypothetical protein